MTTQDKLIKQMTKDIPSIVRDLNAKNQAVVSVASAGIDITNEKDFADKYTAMVDELRQKIKRAFFHPSVLDIQVIVSDDKKWAHLQAQVVGGKRILI